MEDALKCYKVTDGETHFIAARDEDEARDIYVENVNSNDGALLDAKFTELSRESMSKIQIRTSLADLFDDADGPAVLAGTVD